MDEHLISVIVCTYNRCAFLAEVLEGLRRQETGGRFRCEIIVMDNNSSDRTRETVAAFVPRLDGRLRYYFEGRQGKSFALNAGVRRARGGIIAFTDDDVAVDPCWLLNLWRCFKRYRCDAVGGRVLPLYPDGTPGWVIRNSRLLVGPVGMHDNGEETKPYATGDMLTFAGANFAVRAGCPGGGDWFRCDLGTGTLPPGEDTALFKELRAAGRTIYYCGAAVVRHRVKKQKLNYRYVASWAVRAGRANVRRSGQQTGICYFGYPRWILARFARDSMLLYANMFLETEFIRHLIIAFSTLGEIIEYKRSNGTRPRPAYPLPGIPATKLPQIEKDVPEIS